MAIDRARILAWKLMFGSAQEARQPLPSWENNQCYDPEE
jgi:hypothetical protein